MEAEKKPEEGGAGATNTPPDLNEESEERMKLCALSDEQKKNMLLSLRYKYMSHPEILKATKLEIMAPFKDILLEALSVKLKSYEDVQNEYTIKSDPRMGMSYYAMGQAMMGMGQKAIHDENMGI